MYSKLRQFHGMTLRIGREDWDRLGVFAAETKKFCRAPVVGRVYSPGVVYKTAKVSTNFT